MPSAKELPEFVVVEDPPPVGVVDGAPALDVVEDPACVVAGAIEVVVVAGWPEVVVVDEPHPATPADRASTNMDVISTASHDDRIPVGCDDATASSLPTMVNLRLSDGARPEGDAATPPYEPKPGIHHVFPKAAEHEPVPAAHGFVPPGLVIVWPHGSCTC
jgi:hypothetical protein